MLLVLADDLSGAAEVAGIAHSFGLKVTLQSDLDSAIETDVLVVNTDSRMSAYLPTFLEQLQKFFQTKSNIQVFKKVDSVLRGQIAEELSAILTIFPFERIWLLPNNPSMGRKIIERKYFINEIPLYHTSFQNDPDYPRHTNDLEILFEWIGAKQLSHCFKGQKIGNQNGVFTADIASISDLEDLMAQTQKHDLVCGSGDTFKVFLQKYYRNSKHKTIPPKSDLLVYINASTVINDRERDYFKEHSFPIFYADLMDLFFTNNLIEKLKSERAIVVYVNKDHQSKEMEGAKIQEFVSEIVKEITQFFNHKSIHFVISGGATAQTVIDYFDFKKFDVVQEISQGVVTLIPNQAANVMITTKPGAYPWDVQTLQKL